MATERDYRITVSALLARGSVSAAVNDFVSQMMAAKKKVDDILSQPSKGAKDAAAKEGKARVDEAKKAAAELDRIREKENDAILRDVAKTEATKGRIKERYSREERDRNEKTDQERAKRNEKIASDAMGFMRKAAGAAARVAGEVVGGLGVSFDVGSAVRRGMELDTVARRATISGKGALDQNATEADVQSTIATIRAAGVASKQDFGSLAKGLEDFVSKSSDLETGKKVLGDLGRIARATGTDVNELVSAAGDVNKTLEDGPDKADRLLEVMTLVATQSAKGAVEVKDFARYMGRITAGAFKFEGSRAQNIGILSSLAQIAMSGGAAGPREATNAAQAFSNDLTKGEALKRFDAAKIQLFTDDTKTTLRSPEKIITDYLRHSGGNLADLSKYFQNEGSRRVITGFAQKYNAAGGGEAGIKAVEAEFSKFAQTMSSDDVQKRFELSGGSREAKAAEFQNKFDTIVEGMMEKMLPALEKLEGPALKAADALTSLMVAAAEHPWGTVAAVIGGSIAAAVAKQAIGEALGKAIGSGLTGSQLKVAALTVAAVTAYLYLKKTFDEAAEGQSKGVGTQVSAEATSQLARDVAAGRVSKEEALKKMEETYAAGSKQVKLAEKGVGLLDYVNPFGDATNAELGAAQELAAGQESGAKVGGKTELEALKANMAAVKDSIDALKSQMAADAQATKKVMVVNQAPGAPTGGQVAQ
jgi:hypothetical protein